MAEIGGSLLTYNNRPALEQPYSSEVNMGGGLGGGSMPWLCTFDAADVSLALTVSVQNYLVCTLFS